MTTYEKIVKGATKIKVAAPKPKYIEPILLATSRHEDFRTVMRYLQIRLQDSAWSVVYKALIVLHIMIREGERDVTLAFLARNPDMLNVGHINNYNSDTRTLLKYSRYIYARAMGYDATEVDYVRDERVNNSSLSSRRNKETAGGRLRNLTIEKGLLGEVESVEKQIESLLKCKFQEVEVNNDVTLTAFRLLVNDLLALYQSLNEGVINILEHYFEMPKADATWSLKIYKKFVKLTADVVSYLRTAKHLEYTTKLHVPTIRHAPTALADSLEEYLNDKDFESNRKQYLAEKDAKETSGQKKHDDVLSRSRSKGIRAPSSETKPRTTAQTQNNASLTAPQSNTNNNSNGLVVQSTGYNPFAHLVQNQQQPQPTVVQPVILPQQTLIGIPAQGQQIQQVPTLATGQHIFGANGQNLQQQQQQQQQQYQLQLQQQQQAQQQQLQQQQQQQLQQQQQQQLQHAQKVQTGAIHNPFAALQATGIQPLPTVFGFGNFPNAPQMTPNHTQSFSGSSLHQIPENHVTGSNNSTGNTSISGVSLGRSKSVNPFSMGNYTTGIASSTAKNNPFSATNISRSASMKEASYNTGCNNNPFSLNNQKVNNNPVSSPTGIAKTQTTGFNPFAVHNQQTVQPLKPQPTFGGLENLPTVPIFPETQQQHDSQVILSNAQLQLNQAKNQLYQQQTGQLPPQGQQYTGFVPNQYSQVQLQQQPQQNYYNPNVTSLI